MVLSVLIRVHLSAKAALATADPWLMLLPCIFSAEQTGAAMVLHYHGGA